MHVASLRDEQKIRPSVDGFAQQDVDGAPGARRRRQTLVSDKRPQRRRHGVNRLLRLALRRLRQTGGQCVGEAKGSGRQ